MQVLTAVEREGAKPADVNADPNLLTPTSDEGNAEAGASVSAAGSSKRTANATRESLERRFAGAREVRSDELAESPRRLILASTPPRHLDEYVHACGRCMWNRRHQHLRQLVGCARSERHDRNATAAVLSCGRRCTGRKCRPKSCVVLPRRVVPPDRSVSRAPARTHAPRAFAALQAADAGQVCLAQACVAPGEACLDSFDCRRTSSASRRS